MKRLWREPERHLSHPISFSRYTGHGQVFNFFIGIFCTPAHCSLLPTPMTGSCMRFLSSTLIALTFMRIRFLILCRMIVNFPPLVLPLICVKPRNENVSGFPFRCFPDLQSNNNSPGNICPTTVPRPSKLFRMFMGVWQRKRRALPGSVSIR